MKEFIEFLSSREVLIVLIVGLVIGILFSTYFIIKKVSKKMKVRHNTKELTNLVLQIEEETKKEEAVMDKIIDEVKNNEVQAEFISEEVIEVKKGVVPIVLEEKEEVTATVNENVSVEIKKEEEELKYTGLTPSKTEAQEELRKATEELLKTQIEQANDIIDLTKFEAEQEENAIISMEELMRKSEVLYQQNEITQYQDEGNEPISLKDLEKKMNDIKTTTIEDIEEVGPVIIKEEVIESTAPKNIDLSKDYNKVNINDAYKAEHVFKSSPIISPIFGIENSNNSTNSMELENTANYEKLDEEIRKTNEFLVTLKELQKNLD